LRCGCKALKIPEFLPFKIQNSFHSRYRIPSIQDPEFLPFKIQEFLQSINGKTASSPCAPFSLPVAEKSVFFPDGDQPFSFMNRL